MKLHDYDQFSETDLQRLCQRPSVDAERLTSVVQPIIAKVKREGDVALRHYSQLYDQVDLTDILVSQDEITAASARISGVDKAAFVVAATNIRAFHSLQLPKSISLETMPGVTCSRESRPIQSVGLYIPGGKAPLPSTVLMLGIPAQLAGCQNVVLCTPPNKNGLVPDSILYAARLCGINQIAKVGGAQAIAALAYGTETIPKVDKIFGPGNQYVTAAKQLVATDPAGAAIDIPAGPTEVLVIADQTARPSFVVSDLLAQAEHGPDSQVVLVCTDAQMAESVVQELERQLTVLPRQAIAKQALNNSFILLVPTLNEAISFSNRYAPEHLLLAVDEPKKWAQQVQNAGSVFLGHYACESAGDYASGPNHTLPTAGYARAYSGVSTESFLKYVTFQTVTKKGAALIGPTVSRLAALEGLDGHQKAMEIRYKQ